MTNNVCNGCYGRGYFHSTGCKKGVNDTCGRCGGTGKKHGDHCIS